MFQKTVILIFLAVKNSELTVLFSKIQQVLVFQTAIFPWDFPALILSEFLCYLPVMCLYNYRWRVSCSHIQILSSTERNQIYLSYSDESGAVNLGGVSGAEFCDSLCGKVTHSVCSSVTVLCSTSSHVTGLYEQQLNVNQCLMLPLSCVYARSFFSQWNFLVKHWMIIMWGFASKLLWPVLSNCLRICLDRLESHRNLRH